MNRTPQVGEVWGSTSNASSATIDKVMENDGNGLGWVSYTLTGGRGGTRLAAVDLSTFYTWFSPPKEPWETPKNGKLYGLVNAHGTIYAAFYAKPFPKNPINNSHAAAICEVHVTALPGTIEKVES